MKILVSGATGSVGSLVVSQLEKRNVDICVLMRNPGKMNFGTKVDKIKGDLGNADSIKDALNEKKIDVAFLLLTPEGDPSFIRVLENAGVKKVVALSDGTRYAIEDALYESDLEWVMLFPVEFMKNAGIFWRETICKSNIAKTAFPDSKGAHIHEADIADVAVEVLLNSGHEGKSYYLTGPEMLTPRKMIQKISDVIQKDVELVVQTEEEVRAEYAQWGFSEDLIEFAVNSSKNPEEYMYTVLPTVTEITGKPARTFTEWINDHKEEFME